MKTKGPYFQWFYGTFQTLEHLKSFWRLFKSFVALCSEGGRAAFLYHKFACYYKRSLIISIFPTKTLSVKRVRPNFCRLQIYIVSFKWMLVNTKSVDLQAFSRENSRNERKTFWCFRTLFFSKEIKCTVVKIWVSGSSSNEILIM